MEQVEVHLVVDLACVVVEPKPLGVQLDLEDEEGRVLEVAGLVVVVEDQGEDHNLVEGDQEEVVPLVADQTDQEREQEEEACHPDLEDLREVEEGPDQEVEVLEDQEVQVDQEGVVGDPACHLKISRERTHM